MPQAVEYDAFADIYDVWTGVAEVTKQNLPFYVEEYLKTPGPVVELGIGNGRIAIEAAKQGKSIIGVDSSTAMLKLCRERAEAAGVADRLTLIQADFRDFELPEPAELITIPFHTIGHLVTITDKRRALCHIYGQLAPGGRLIFDHFIFDLEFARRYQCQAILHAEYTDPQTDRDVLLWVTNRYDLSDQTIRIITWTDELNEEGEVIRRKYRRLNFSWIDPEQARILLQTAGFEIEALYGDFDRRPFGPDSQRQVWVARRPALS